MNKVMLLDCLKKFTETETKDIIMPVRMQKGDAEQAYRTADVYKMRLPDSGAAQKKAPYIIHQVITGKDVQARGDIENGTAVVRSIFCVYHNDEQEGALILLNLMERVRIGLLRDVLIGERYLLDLETGLETLIYPDDTAPYYAGEMVSTWKLPSVEREVIL